MSWIYSVSFTTTKIKWCLTGSDTGDINSHMFLRGVGAGCNTKEVIDRLRYLKAEIEDLELKERELDQQKLWLQQSIKNVMDDSINNRYPFKYAIHIHNIYIFFQSEDQLLYSGVFRVQFCKWI